MVVTAKELRLKTTEVLKKVQKAGSVTITFRGKPIANITALERPAEESVKNDPAFGIWKNRKDLGNAQAWVRKMRKPRFSL
ncbi:MAG: type II toxin-antitoxin system Phd/YefM family antitoxin [Terriglobia bacterium]